MNNKFIQNYILIIIISLIGLYLIKAFDISYPITITSTTKSTELAVVGEGKVEVIPDTAYVDLGITVNDVSSVEEAQKTINQVNNNIVKALKEIGIKKEDIKTTNYSVNQNYKYEGRVNLISGYNGNATIEVKVKDPQMVSRVITVGSEAGVNQIQGSRFVVSEPEKYRETARNLAIKNAQEQAQKIAANLGIKLGKTVNIVESSPEQTYPVYGAVKTAGLGGGGPNIEPGNQTITSIVTLYFEKK